MVNEKYNVTLRFRDGVENTIQVGPDEDILEVALSENVPILYQCQSGSCASCLGHLKAGTANMRRDVAASLLKSEQEEGQRLVCVTRPESDCLIELDYDSTAGEIRPVDANAFIEELDWIAKDVVRLKLELAEGDWIDFKPGQFIQIKVPGTDDYRSYSMSSTAHDLPYIELLIRILDDGVMSNYLRQQAKPDDVLEIRGAYGSFFLRDDLKVPHIMIAGGTGLAPMMSMLDVIRKKSGRKPKTLLSFGCPDADSLFHLEQVELREFWMPTLETRVSIDRGEEGGVARIGNPVSAITSDDVTDENTVAYLCGPPGMISAARDRLEGLGLKPENIHAEQFVPSA